MTLTEARRVRDFFRSRRIHSIVPLGHGPDGYYAEIIASDIGERGYRKMPFGSMAEARSHVAMRLRWERAFKRECLEFENRKPPRSPIDVMIDRACGLL